MQLSWEQVTALATVTGVVGGLISVVFLVYEIRRNAQAIEGATVQSLMTLEAQVFSTLVDHAEIFSRGCADEKQLSDVEQFKFQELVAVVMSLTYSAYVQHQQNLIDDEVWQAYANAMFSRMARPGFLAAWRRKAASYPRSFQDLVDSGVSRASS